MSEKAREAARKVLDQFGSKIPVPIDAILKAHGIEVFADNEMAPTVSGILMIKKDRVGAMVNHTHPEARKRFTLAHELGHYLLHRRNTNLFVDEVAVLYRSGYSDTGTGRMEVEANVFAAELLMPEKVLREHLKSDPSVAQSDEAIRKLARRYDVSSAAMKYRLRQLKIIANV